MSTELAAFAYGSGKLLAQAPCCWIEALIRRDAELFGAPQDEVELRIKLISRALLRWLSVTTVFILPILLMLDSAQRRYFVSA